MGMKAYYGVVAMLVCLLASRHDFEGDSEPDLFWRHYMMFNQMLEFFSHSCNFLKSFFPEVA